MTLPGQAARWVSGRLLFPQQPSEARRDLQRWLIIGLLLRLAIMPFTASIDLFFNYTFPAAIAFQAVPEVYSYLRDHFGWFVESVGGIYYPPLTSYLLGAFLKVAEPILPGFATWAETARETTLSGYIHHVLATAGSIPLLWTLAVLKLPMLAADLASAVLLARLAGSAATAVRALRIWAVNLPLLYAAYAWGSIDIVLGFVVLLGLALAPRYPRAAILALGAAGAMKWLPMLLVPLAALSLAPTWRGRLWLLSIGTAPYAAGALLVALRAPEYLPAILTGTPFILERSAATASRLAFLLRVSALLGYGLLLLLALRRGTGPTTWMSLWLAAFLLFFVSTPVMHFHWLMMAMPLLVLWTARNPRYWLLSLLLSVSLVPFTFVPTWSWAALLAPLAPDVFPALPSPEALLDRLTPWGNVARGAWYIFVATSVALFVLLVRAAVAGGHTFPQPRRWPSVMWAGGAGALASLAVLTAQWLAPLLFPAHWDRALPVIWQLPPPAEFAPLGSGPGAAATLRQEFRSDFAELATFDVYLRGQPSFDRLDAVLRPADEGPGGTPLAPSGWTPDGYLRFALPPEPDSRGRVYEVRLTYAGGEEAQTIEVGLAPPWAHTPFEGTAFQDDRALPLSLAFRTLHRPPIDLPSLAPKVWGQVQSSLPWLFLWGSAVIGLLALLVRVHHNGAS